MSRRKRPLSNFRTLRLESLEERRLMAADLTLSAGFRTSPYSPGTQVYVDGSDYNDVVRVTDYSPSTGSITLKLEQYSGSTLLSSRITRFHSSNLTPVYTVQVDGRGGDDTITNYTPATMLANGGEGNDYLVGGSSSDYLIGGNGLNIMSGNEGDDTLTGGNQRDVIYGGAGNDTIQGGDGDDLLYGDTSSGSALIAGNDHIYGGKGNDNIYGEAGFDIIEGNDGNDILVGGLGDDSMYGGAGDDWMYGDAGSDRLWGHEGVDHLYGGADDDFLDGGFWSSPDFNQPDLLYGGTGADTFVRHNSTFGFSDVDYFGDFHANEGDKWQDVRHW